MPPPVIDALFQFLSTWTGTRGRLYLSFHLGGGAVANIPAGETAYPYRDTLFWGQFAVAGPGVLPEESKEFVSGIVNIITDGVPNGVFGAYVGHVDPSLINPRRRTGVQPSPD